jgi:hypothetical protein
LPGISFPCLPSCDNPLTLDFSSAGFWPGDQQLTALLGQDLAFPELNSPSTDNQQKGDVK